MWRNHWPRISARFGTHQRAPRRLLAIIALSLGSIALPEVAPAQSQVHALTSDLDPLFKQLHEAPAAQWATKGAPIRQAIDATLSAYLQKSLASVPPPSASMLENQINSALRQSIWETVFHISSQESPQAAPSTQPHLVSVLQGSNQDAGLYVAAFAIGYGNVYSVFLHGFRRASASAPLTLQTAELEDTLPNAILIQHSHSHEIRFLIWGLRIGSPDGLTSVLLYSFDGTHLRQLWSRTSVPRATVTLSGEQVQIESSKVLSLKAGSWTHVRDTYSQTAEGLKLVETKNWVSH